MKNPDRVRVLSSAEDLAVEVYRATASFPSHERFGLTSQMRRAAISIGSNVAEGCGLQGDKAFVASVHRSLGEANELSFQIKVSMRLGYGSAPDLHALAASTTSVSKMLSRLIAALR